MMIATPFALFMRRELPSRQMLILTLISLLPSGIYLIVRIAGHGLQFFETAGAPLIIHGPMTIIPIFFSVAAFHEDFEQRTIVYLLTRPPSRTAYVIAKFLSAWLCAFIAVGVGIVVLGLLSMWGRWQNTDYYFSLIGKLLFTSLLGTGVYTGLFLIFGLWLKNPVIFGLIFTAGWEWIAGNIPGKLQFWTASLYPKCLFIELADADPSAFFPEAEPSVPIGGSLLPAAARRVVMLAPDLPSPSATQCVITMIGIIIGAFVVASYLFRNREDA
ncbi:MAG: ABC transporter permease [Planctomycetota bacterium]